MPLAERSVRFVPEGVEGVSNVREAAVFHDRLELLTDGEMIAIRWRDIARWHSSGWCYCWLAKLGWIVGWPAVADRMWRPSPGICQFEFYTSPPITIRIGYAPGEDGLNAVFQAVKNVLLAGGYSTFDLL